MRALSSTLKPPVSERHAELRRRLQSDPPAVAPFPTKAPPPASPPPIISSVIPWPTASPAEASSSGSHGGALRGGGGGRPLLEDRFGRFHDYLRISVTERCNFRCTYCMPAEGVDLTPDGEILTLDEMVRLAAFFADAGVRKIRLTGGEPLVRPGVVGLVERLAALPGVESVGLTTNGLLLGRHLPALRAAGLASVNVSLDTLQASKFEAVTRRKGHARVLEAVQLAAATEGLAVKVNCVVMRGMNEGELGDFAALAVGSASGPSDGRLLGGGFDVRFIEWMPFDLNAWDHAKFVGYDEMRRLVEAQRPDLQLERLDADAEARGSDTTKWYRVTAGESGSRGARIGFITSMSEHFCSTCNRLRVTADGRVKACLFGEREFDLRAALRAGDAGALAAAVGAAVGRKDFKLGGHADMHEIKAQDATNRSMVRIGG